MVPDPDFITDDEELYRSVKQEHLIYENGVLRAISEAFGDRNQRVSVDRASLVDNDPRRTQKSGTDAVARLVAGAVRCSLPRRDAKGQETGTYAIDVIPEPLPDNPAHAVIYANPSFVSPNHFRKLRERLARIHQLVLLPDNEVSFGDTT
jgi:hypothetical protein